jgi:hypothetical protein
MMANFFCRPPYIELNQKVLWQFALRQMVNGIKGKTLTEELLEPTDSNYILTYLKHKTL